MLLQKWISAETSEMISFQEKNKKNWANRAAEFTENGKLLEDETMLYR